MSDKKIRRNEEIRAPSVRVIGADGSQAGIMSSAAALQMARAAALDLVEVAPGASPAVVRIMDFGKYLFEQKKKTRVTRAPALKEFSLRPVIGEADLKVKLSHIFEFLEAGHRVKVTVRFKGREITHPDLGRRVLDRVVSATAAVSSVEQSPKFEGKQLIMQLAPRRV